MLAATWTGADLEGLLPSLLTYLNTARKRESENASQVSCDSCEPSRVERDRLLGETERRVGVTDRRVISKLAPPQRLNDLIQRAVILHSDALMRVPKDTTRRAPRTAASNVLRAPRQIVTTDDGQYVGAAAETPHWSMARALLQFVTPEPSLDARTRSWYLAAAAYMEARSDLAQLRTHLERMAALYPKDAEVAFDLGWQSELHATDRAQAHLRAVLDVARNQRNGGLGGCQTIACDDAGNPLGIKNVRESLSDAERHFARAVRLDPMLTEAHIRLAHVRTRLGRYADAETALRKLPPSDDPFVAFYAAIVHGTTLEGLARLDEAAAAYERGLALAPHAPSVNLALSAVELRRGDTAMSVMYARRAIEPPKNPGVVDPFALYYLGRGRNVGMTWTAFYAELGQ